jgi:hypothetical protein
MVKLKKYISYICKLSLLFSFLLSVPDVQAPNVSNDVLSKITKIKFFDFVQIATKSTKSSQFKNAKNSHQVKFFSKSLHYKILVTQQNYIFSEIFIGIQTVCNMAMQARAPPHV